jgi:glycosyltransferase involved in cell wall biosynthesis
MRILLTVPHLSSTAHPYRLMMAIARYLPRDEFTIGICALRPKGSDETIPRLREFGIEPIIARYRPRNWSWHGLAQCLRDQAEIDRLGPFDIQHSLDFTSSPFEGLLVRRKRRFMFSQCNLAENSNRALLRLKIRRAWRIVAISSAVNDLLLDLGARSERVRRITLGIDTSIDTGFTSAVGRTADEPPAVICVGQIQRRKRQEDAIRAVAELARKVPNVRLDIVGEVYDAAYQRYLEQLAHDLGIAANVRFLGERNNVLDLMRRSHAFIHCAESEALGWVVVEAMSVGIPTVLGDSEGPKEIMEPGAGVLVRVGDIAGYAAGLERVLNDSADTRDMIARARGIVDRRYSARAMVEQYANVYRELRG